MRMVTRDGLDEDLLQDRRVLENLRLGCRSMPQIGPQDSSVANPKFVSLWSKAGSEFQIQSHTSNLLNLVWLWI